MNALRRWLYLPKMMWIVGPCLLKLIAVWGYRWNTSDEGLRLMQAHYPLEFARFEKLWRASHDHVRPRRPE